MSLTIKYQNDHALSFAKNIEGIQVGIELSHPRVVTASLNELNSTIHLTSHGTGECNIRIYMLNNPKIYDVFRVKVSSVVRPSSPVQIHLGASVSFKILDAAEKTLSTEGATWTSNNPHIVEIDSVSGQARGISEGKTEITLRNHISAASIVQVSKVRHAEVAEKNRKALFINTDEDSDEVRIKLKLYLKDQVEELMPTVQYEGVTLINQNVGVKCHTDIPNII